MFVSVQPCTDTNIDVRELLHGHFFALYRQNVSIHTYVLTQFLKYSCVRVRALSVSEFKLAKLLKMKLYLTKLVDKKIQARFTGKGSEYIVTFKNFHYYFCPPPAIHYKRRNSNKHRFKSSAIILLDVFKTKKKPMN